MAVLTILKGHELGWICLGAGCGVDVIINACALFWATGGANGVASGHQSGGTTGSRIPTGQDKRRRMTVVVPPFGAKEEHELSPSPSRRAFGPISAAICDDRSVKNAWETTPPSTQQEVLPSAPSSPTQARASLLTKVFGSGQKPMSSATRVDPPVQITVTTHHQTDRPLNEISTSQV
ncbi:hypothetical protein DL96DRAFT_1588402 [Flagelloscypha sp. PMI_526]|nr:hypothetical protein DL96DRAFT_1588402 [Flagelloscypha sp. PMI_526]